MVHLQFHRIADGQTAVLHRAAMHMQSIPRCFLGVGHFDPRAIDERNSSGIAHLATGFAIERRLVDHHRRFTLTGAAVDRLAVHDKGHDLTLPLFRCQ